MPMAPTALNFSQRTRPLGDPRWRSDDGRRSHGSRSSLHAAMFARRGTAAYGRTSDADRAAYVEDLVVAVQRPVGRWKTAGFLQSAGGEVQWASSRTTCGTRPAYRSRGRTGWTAAKEDEKSDGDQRAHVSGEAGLPSARPSRCCRNVVEAVAGRCRWRTRAECRQAIAEQLSTETDRSEQPGAVEPNMA